MTTLPLLVALLSWFGWWDNADMHWTPARTTASEAQIREAAPYTNVTMAVRWDVPEDWAAAEAVGAKVILLWPHPALLAFASTADVDWSLVVCCTGRTLAEWVYTVRAHQDRVVAIMVADEPELHVLGGPNTWTPGNNRALGARLEAHLAIVRSALPGIPTWINHTSAWFNWALVGPLGTASPNGVPIPSADWLSLDCYTPWDACYGRGVTVERLYAAWKPYLSPSQRFALIPQGNLANWFGVTLTPTEVAAVAEQYYQYALREPRVVGIFPFIWWGIEGESVGGGFEPTIRAAYASIGQRLLQRLVPPAPVRGLRIVR